MAAATISRARDGADMDYVEIATDESSARIYLHGATLTSWKCAGVENLYLSDTAVFDGKAAIRGGIPVVFPQFGPGVLANHGFARTSTWTLGEQRVDEGAGAVAVTLELSDSEATRAVWPHRFHLAYTVRLTRAQLSTTLSVQNLGDAPFPFQALLHTYHRVTGGVESVQVHGLRGLTLLDKMDGMRASEEDREVVTIGREVDRIYRQAPRELVLHGTPRPVRIALAFGRAGADGAVEEQEPGDVVVWNPWIDKCRAMADMQDDDYKRMVCVEPGHVAGWRTLGAGERWAVAQALEHVEL